MYNYINDNLLRDILVKGIYARNIIKRNDGTIYICEVIHIKKPILRYIDGEICIQQSSKVAVSWVNFKVFEYTFSWAFNKEDFASAEDTEKHYKLLATKEIKVNELTESEVQAIKETKLEVVE